MSASEKVGIRCENWLPWLRSNQVAMTFGIFINFWMIERTFSKICGRDIVCECPTGHKRHTMQSSTPNRFILFIDRLRRYVVLNKAVWTVPVSKSRTLPSLGGTRAGGRRSEITWQTAIAIVKFVYNRIC